MRLLLTINGNTILLLMAKPKVSLILIKGFQMNKASVVFFFIMIVGYLPYVNAQTALDTEELRLGHASITLPEVTSRYQSLVESFDTQYRQSTDELEVTEMVAKYGQRLWLQALKDVQSGTIDDRPLYWSRSRCLKH